MHLISCYLTNSTWYKGTSFGTPVGVLWHDTGAGNQNVSRYVQPYTNNQQLFQQMTNVIGVNKYGNDWNHIEREAGVNAWIGKLKDGSIGTVLAGPLTMRPWGSGDNSNGHIDGRFWVQFEICDDYWNNRNPSRDYFDKCFEEACQFTAYVCRNYKIDPFGTVQIAGKNLPTITCHRESNYNWGVSGHSDTMLWFNKFGKTMQDVRNRVHELLTNYIVTYENISNGFVNHQRIEFIPSVNIFSGDYTIDYTKITRLPNQTRYNTDISVKEQIDTLGLGLEVSVSKKEPTTEEDKKSTVIQNLIAFLTDFSNNIVTVQAKQGETPITDATTTFEISTNTEDPIKYVPGDFNRDEQITSDDITVLEKFITRNKQTAIENSGQIEHQGPIYTLQTIKQVISVTSNGEDITSGAEISVYNGNVVLTFETVPANEFTVIGYIDAPLPPYPKQNENGDPIDYELGDVYLDGVVDQKDLTYLSNYVGATKKVEKKCEFSGDGETKIFEILEKDRFFGLSSVAVNGVDKTNEVFYNDNKITFKYNAPSNGSKIEVTGYNLDYTEANQKFPLYQKCYCDNCHTRLNENSQCTNTICFCSPYYSKGIKQETKKEREIRGTVLRGDFNEDGVVDENDVWYLKNYIETFILQREIEKLGEDIIYNDQNHNPCLFLPYEFISVHDVLVNNVSVFDSVKIYDIAPIFSTEEIPQSYPDTIKNYMMNYTFFPDMYPLPACCIYFPNMTFNNEDIIKIVCKDNQEELMKQSDMNDKYLAGKDVWMNITDTKFTKQEEYTVERYGDGHTDNFTIPDMIGVESVLLNDIDVTNQVNIETTYEDSEIVSCTVNFSEAPQENTTDNPFIIKINGYKKLETTAQPTQEDQKKVSIKQSQQEVMTTVLNQSGDLNGDGKVDMDDVDYLLNHIRDPFNWPLYPYGVEKVKVYQ